MQRLILGNKDISTSLKMDGKYIDVAWPIYTSSIEIEYLVVGGGAGGGVGTQSPPYVGGGGAAGAINTGSFVLQTVDTAPDPFTVKVVAGLGGQGAGSGPGKSGQDGGYSFVGFNLFQALGAAGSGEGGKTSEQTVTPSGGASGLGNAGPLTGSFESFREGGFNDFYNNAAGGGAGSSQIGQDGTENGGNDAVGGNGGQGVNVNDWYWNSFLDVVGIIAGGGGASAQTGVSQAAGVGTAGGGDGAIGSNDGSDATKFGSGGGGAYLGNGGNGADGLVVLRYQNRFPINNSGDEVFQVGDYWYHTITTGSLSNDGTVFERPEKILIDV